MSVVLDASKLPEEFRDTYEYALEGDVDAMKEIADQLIYWNPKAEPSKSEIRLARRFYRKAILDGNATAMLNYGGIFTNEGNKITNHLAAHFWYLMAIFIYKRNPGEDRSGYRALGNSWKYDYDELGQPTPTKNRLRLLVALFWYQHGAKENEMNSLYELGDFYRDGTIIKRDLDMAFGYYLNALDAILDGPCPEADDNYDDVALRLAQCYRIGIGTEKNLEKALFYAEAAESKYNRTVEKGGKWDQKFLNEARVETIRIHREMGLES